MEKTIAAINRFLKSLNWHYDFKEIEENYSLFSCGISMDNALGNIRLNVSVYKEHYNVTAVFNNKVEASHYNEVAEYLHRANFGLNDGNFEFDYDTGLVRYKTYVNFEGIEVSDSLVESSIIIPILMFDRYGKNLLKLMVGEGNPKKLIEESESRKTSPDEEATQE